jgi:tetratricopeptide (TPR) repeat protein
MPVPQIGDRLAQYEILSAIGAGGMGYVLRARDTRLRRDVAIKVLAPERAADPEMRARFEREARSVAALAHPGVVAIYELAKVDDLPFIVMECLEGTNLRQRIEAGPLPCHTAIDIVTQVADALGAAHAAGIVHRDLKPENVFLTRSGSVKILDFGLARRAVGPYDTGDLSLTGPHMLIGTIRYMSPEQARGETSTTASDVFSAGVLLYELITGRHPFEANSVVGLLHAVMHDAPTTPFSLNPAIPGGLEALILQMLAKDHLRRPNASTVASRLRQIACEGEAAEPQQRVLPAARLHTVGRARERETLRASWTAACAGRPSLVSIAGEPGIGKTTLVDDFLGEIKRSGAPCLVGRGRCSETLAMTEAYLPILEALETLVREGGEPVQRLLKQLAPTWHLQIAPLVLIDSSAERLRQELRSASQQRVKWEFRAFLQELSCQSPVVLFLDDAHWADPATVDLLAYVGRALGNLRLLILTTCRVSELLLGGNGLASLLLDFQARGVARELQLPFLERIDVERYLDLEFPDHAFPAGFATLIHDKTEGSPLFMVDLLADLRERDIISRDGRWRLADDMPAIGRQLPASIRSMIQRRLTHLTEEDLRLLRVASIHGHYFDSLVVAEASQLPVIEVEERLEELERVHSLVRMIEERDLPDRMLTTRYQFVHVLYQNALQGSLTPARRAALSAAVAESLRSHYAGQIGPVATRIGFLFESARQFTPAAEAYCAAAAHTSQLLAHREAAALARRGLTTLQSVPQTPQRSRLELTLLVTLGGALLVTEGYASLESKRTYLRARELCHSLGNGPELFPILWGLWNYYTSVADHEAAVQLASELVALAEYRRPQDRVRAAWAHGTTKLFLGNAARAVKELTDGVDASDEQDDRIDRHLYGHDAGITCRCFGAWARWFVGEGATAVEEVERACEAAAALSHPQSLAFALLISAIVHQSSGDVGQTMVRAREAHAISVREGLHALFAESSRMLIGWAEAATGRSVEGMATSAEALDSLQQLGSFVGRPYFLGLFADMIGATRPNEAIGVIDDAIEHAVSTHEWLWHPELLRLKGEMLALRGDFAAARHLLAESLDIATTQGSAAYLQRTRESLLRLTRDKQSHAAPQAHTGPFGPD